MDAPASTRVFLFKGCLDRRGSGLFRVDDRGGFVPVAIRSRALDALGVLVKRPGSLVSKATSYPPSGRRRSSRRAI
jgi:hypothetical protein